MRGQPLKRFIVATTQSGMTLVIDRAAEPSPRVWAECPGEMEGQAVAVALNELDSAPAPQVVDHNEDPF